MLAEEKLYQEREQTGKRILLLAAFRHTVSRGSHTPPPSTSVRSEERLNRTRTESYVSIIICLLKACEHTNVMETKKLLYSIPVAVACLLSACTPRTEIIETQRTIAVPYERGRIISCPIGQYYNATLNMCISY